MCTGHRRLRTHHQTWRIVPPIVFIPINHPRSFDINNYSNWKDEICFWRDAQSHVREEQLVDELAPSLSKVYRPDMMRFMRDTASSRGLRTVPILLLEIGKEFIRDATDRSMGKLQKSNVFKKNAPEPYTPNGFALEDWWANYTALD